MSVPVDDQDPGSERETYSSLADQTSIERPEEEERKERTGCFRKGCLTLLMLLLILFLLLLFWPVPHSQKEQLVKKRPTALGRLTKGPRRIGNAKYGEVHAVRTPILGTAAKATTKGSLVLLRFSVKNISSQTYAFDVYNFSLTDVSGREFMPNEDSMARYAEDRGKIDVWPKKVSAGKTVAVEAIFEVEKSAQGLALVARDFDLRYNESITIPIPTKNIKVIKMKVD